MSFYRAGKLYDADETDSGNGNVTNVLPG